VISIAGISALDSSSSLANAGVAYLILKEWSARGAGQDLRSLFVGLNEKMSDIEEARILVIPPPPIQGIGNAAGFAMQVQLRDGSVEQVSNPARLPDPALIEEIREPVIACKIFVPQEYVGPVITLCTQKRGTQTNMHYSARHVVISYDLPLNEVVLDFFDRLKSMTRGYGSLDYEFKEYRAADMVRLDILVNGERVDALSSMVHRETAQLRGRDLVTRLRGLIPRQMFDVAVQAAIGGHIIARENVKALRKNVLAKCYGGDATRKRKLLEKQKEGKKRMKQVGSVEIPQEAFLAVLQRSDR